MHIDRDSLAHALGDDAEVLKQVQAAPDAAALLHGKLRSKTHAEAADPQAATLGAHDGAFNARAKPRDLDPRLPQAEQQAGAQTAAHGGGQQARRIRSVGFAQRRQLVYDERRPFALRKLDGERVVVAQRQRDCESVAQR